ncbi:MAG: acyl-CoA dehydratase activase [Candidatus Omnitrophota bacterium]
MIHIGIDSGSTITKLAAVGGGEVIFKRSAPTGTDPISSGKTLLAQALVSPELAGGETPLVCLTGYGRRILSGLGIQKTEISCHALGAHKLIDTNEQFILLDIGGQDSKAIKVDPAGKAADFAMNDKCAAGTGRFLEVISRTLGFGIEGLSEAALTSRREARLSSMCTVFADSEAVSLIARGEKPEEIAWAACFAVAERCAGLVKRVGLNASDNTACKTLVFTGGVSRIPAVAEALREILGTEVMVPPMAEYSGAVGAALFASR